MDKTAREVPGDTIVYIHLPGVTYEGSLVIGERSINLHGGEEGKTVFTGGIQVTQELGNICYFDGLEIRDSGEGIGISASARVHLTNCKISGWRTGLLAYGTTWVNATDCVFEDDQVGFHFNAAGATVTHTTYRGNTFRRNGTAVLLESVPADAGLRFPDCLFSGNGVDIDNRCGRELDISRAGFE